MRKIVAAVLMAMALAGCAGQTTTTTATTPTTTASTYKYEKPVVAAVDLGGFRRAVAKSGLDYTNPVDRAMDICHWFDLDRSLADVQRSETNDLWNQDVAHHDVYPMTRYELDAGLLIADTLRYYCPQHRDNMPGLEIPADAPR
jgi:hypothetical protein